MHGIFYTVNVTSSPGFYTAEIAEYGLRVEGNTASGVQHRFCELLHSARYEVFSRLHVTENAGQYANYMPYRHGWAVNAKGHTVEVTEYRRMQFGVGAVYTQIRCVPRGRPPFWNAVSKYPCAQSESEARNDMRNIWSSRIAAVEKSLSKMSDRVWALEREIARMRHRTPARYR